MTEHEHAEVSRKLALAIGWTDEDVYTGTISGAKAVEVFAANGEWTEFDYRDPLVIWRIAERFNCFPVKDEVFIEEPRLSWECSYADGPVYFGDTAALAVARAVIAAKEKA